MLLVIDIGGTNTRIAHCMANEDNMGLCEKKTYMSRQFNSIEEIIERYQTEKGLKATSIILGVPGPVDDEIIKPTNLNWIIDKNKIARVFSISNIHILNDVQALGHAIAVLPENDFHSLNKGNGIKSAPTAILAPGTGLGESFLICHGNVWKAYPSEGGHCDFAPTNKIESELFFFLQNKYGHVSYERICSGPGLCDIYNFLKTMSIGFESDEAEKLIKEAPDTAKAISEIALSAGRNESTAQKTFDLFASVIGAEAGNLALRFGARRGIYIGGGIIPKILSIFNRDLFLNAFKNKGRFSKFMSDIPVKVICNTEANLYGLSNVKI